MLNNSSLTTDSRGTSDDISGKGLYRKVFLVLCFLPLR